MRLISHFLSLIPGLCLSTVCFSLVCSQGCAAETSDGAKPTGSDAPLHVQPVASKGFMAAGKEPAREIAGEPVKEVAKEPTKELPPPFKVSKGFSHFVQKYSGVTWLTNEATSGILSTALSLKTHGLVHAKVRTYGFTDLLDGEFRSVDIRANGGNFKGVPFGDVHVATTTPFKLRYFQRKGHNSGLRTPVMINVEGDMAEKDLSHALKSPAVTSGLRFLKLDLPGLGQQHLQVLQPKVNLDGNRIILDTFLITAGAAKETGVPLHVVATPRLENERFIVLKDMQLQSSEIQDPSDFAEFTDKLLNPLVDFGKMDRFTHAFRMSKFRINDEHVNYAGRLLLAPKPASKPTFSAPFTMNQQQLQKQSTPPPIESSVTVNGASAEH